MERWHDGNALIVEPFAAGGGDAFAVHKEIERDGAEQDDGFRLDKFNLSFEIRQACGGFVRFRIAVAWWAAFDDVRDVAAVFSVLRRAIQPHGVDHARQQLTCTADERDSLLIFFFSRTFADEHDTGMAETVFHDVVLLSCIKRTGAAGKDGLFQRLPVHAGGRWRRVDFDWALWL